MNIQQNISLKKYNTFGIDVNAKHFVSVTSIRELTNVLQLEKHSKKFILGGGSNMLLTKNIDALVIHINIKGIEVVSEDENYVFVKASAGENWHDFVLWTLKNKYGGLENLSLIPGNVGTAPIQNIGAYGVELKDNFVSCNAIEIATQQLKTFNAKDCKFNYRNSIFKNEAKGKYIITDVTFKLTKKNHKLNTSYGAIEEKLQENHIKNPTITHISDAVISIRQQKLPNPVELGNSGSFFKNPVINEDDFSNIQKKYPQLPYYKIDEKETLNQKLETRNLKLETKNQKPETHYKIPAGWLIEQCGFKGKRFGDAGVHEKQALVLVNYGNATGKEIWKLAITIQTTIKETFGIVLEPEVNII